MKVERTTIQSVLEHYSDTQAIFLFGSYGQDTAGPAADIDIALLLPPGRAKNINSLYATELHFELERLFSRDVDLINLRRVSTVFQKEIIMTGRRIYCSDNNAVDEFEMLTLSFYQKLNDERKEIVHDFIHSVSGEIP